jgi:hypothetical protein
VEPEVSLLRIEQPPHAYDDVLHYFLDLRFVFFVANAQLNEVQSNFLWLRCEKRVRIMKEGGDVINRKWKFAVVRSIVKANHNCLR